MRHDAEALFARTDRELWLLTSQAGQRRGGLIATFVSKASILPTQPRVLVGLARHHHTWGVVEESQAFALHLFSEAHLDWVWRFGLTSGHDQDKFAGLEVNPSPNGCPLVSGALGWLDCRVEERLDAGDRTIYLAEILEAQVSDPGPPLTMHRLLAMAPGEKMEILRTQMTLDRLKDAAALEAWRQRRSMKSP